MGRQAKRTKRRMACALIAGRQRFSGVVLDLSASGVFVQTTAKPQPRDPVTVELGVPGHRDPIRLETCVARLFMVPAQLVAVAQGGVGLRITNAPEAYFELLQSIQGERSRTPADAGASESGAAWDSRRPYRVRMTQLGRARTRTLRVLADSHEDAVERALEETGDGWKVLEASVEDGSASGG